jgi:hypothetical protein
LFDGRDAAINIIRIIQNSGAEVIHLGHNRIGANRGLRHSGMCIAITATRTGTMGSYFKYIFDLLEGALAQTHYPKSSAAAVAANSTHLGSQQTAGLWHPLPITRPDDGLQAYRA